MSESDFEPNIEEKKVKMKKMTMSEFRSFQDDAGSSSDDFVSETTQKRFEEPSERFTFYYCSSSKR